MHKTAFPSFPDQKFEKDISIEFSEILSQCEEFTFACNLLQLLTELTPMNSRLQYSFKPNNRTQLQDASQELRSFMSSILIISSVQKELVYEMAKSSMEVKLALGQAISRALEDVEKDNVLIQGYTKDSIGGVKPLNTNSITTLFMNEEWRQVHLMAGDSLFIFVISNFYVRSVEVMIGI